MLHRCLASLHLVALLALATSAAQADGATAKESLRDRLSALIEKSGLGGNMGAVVADAKTGERLYTLDPETPRNPASNMKLVTALTALVTLGPEHRLRTTVSGAVDERGHVPLLVIRGEGDPSLRFEDLLAFARRLFELGVREVDEIVVDGSYFDGQVLPPAFDQQPKEVAAFRAPVAALSVDRNAYELRVAPGPAADAPAQVILRCPDHFTVETSLSTSAEGRPKISAEQKADGDKLALRLSGSIPLGGRGIGFERRIDAPLAYAGSCLRAALQTVAIRGALGVRIGTTSDTPPLLLTHESMPVSVLLQRVGKNSDNFVAEMLLKVIGGVTSDAPASSKAGVARAEQLLTSLGVPSARATIVNGSGLFKGGALSPDALLAVLMHAYRDPTIYPEYLGQLAVAGKDGTLSGRLSDLKPARVVRAKTGTLDDVVALSGYVLGPPGKPTLAFSFLVGGVSGKQWVARDLVDAMVRSMVAYLYP